MPDEDISDRQYAFETLDMTVALLAELKCPSHSLVSSTSLLRDVVRPGERVYAVFGTYRGVLSANWLQTFVVFLWNELPKTAAGIQAAPWLDHAAALVEGVTVALLELSQAPTSGELATASERTLDLAKRRIAGLKQGLPEQLEALECSTSCLAIKMSSDAKWDRHPSVAGLRPLVPALYALSDVVNQLAFTPSVAGRNGDDAKPVLEWVDRVYVLLLECARRRDHFILSPTSSLRTGYAVAAKVTRLRRETNAFLFPPGSTASVPSAASSSTAPPPPYADLQPLAEGKEERETGSTPHN